MKKKVLLTFALALMLVCIFTISVSAVEDSCDAEYYSKVYTSANGVEMPLYEKDGDKYYPLVWFAYDILGEDGTTIVETKYVSARFEDVTMYSQEPGQGRFNGVYYEYTDEAGNEMVLDSGHVVLLNLRSGVATKTMRANGSNSSTNVTIKTFEWGNTYSGYPSFKLLEAVYLPLSATVASAPSTVVVFDIDRHHETEITFGTGALRNTKIKEIFVPGSATGFSNGNSQFQWAYSLETIIFGKGFNQNISAYTFQDNPLKHVYWMGTLSELEAITVATINNSSFHNLTRISLTDYLNLDDETQANGKYLIYDVTECYLYGHASVSLNDCVSQCSICNEKTVNHSENASVDVSVVYTDFIKAGTRTTTCTNEGCEYCVVESLKPIFYWVGYSAKTFGEEKAFGQQYIINQAELGAYKAYVESQGDIFSYGVVAAGASSAGQPLAIVEDVVTNKEGAQSICFDQLTYDAFFMNISGIDAGSLDVALMCCAYVRVGDEIVYLDNNQTVDTVELTSFAKIDAIVNPKEEIA